MSDAEVTRVFLMCGAIEASAWGAAWFFDWSIVSLVVAVGVSTAVAGVIVQVTQRRNRERKDG
jgi:membrane associated rhomboid family serine protease